MSNNIQKILVYRDPAYLKSKTLPHRYHSILQFRNCILEENQVFLHARADLIHANLHEFSGPVLSKHGIKKEQVRARSSRPARKRSRSAAHETPINSRSPYARSSRGIPAQRAASNQPARRGRGLKIPASAAPIRKSIGARSPTFHPEIRERRPLNALAGGARRIGVGSTPPLREPNQSTLTPIRTPALPGEGRHPRPRRRR